MTWDEFSGEIDIGMILIVGLIGGLILCIWNHNFKQKKLQQAKSTIYGHTESGPITKEYNVKIIEKSNYMHNVHADWSIQVNCCTFELSNGQRLRLAIEEQHQYDTMTQGDIGTLKYIRTKFIGFDI